MKTIKILRQNMPKINLIIYFLFAIVITGCNKDDAPPPTPEAIVETTPEGEEPKLSDAKEITSFVFLLTNNPIEINVVATIDDENKTITAAMPPGTNITGLLPEVKISELSTIDRDTAQDFTEPLEYILTAEDGSKVTYTITITALLTQRQFLQLILDVNPDNTLDWDLNATQNLGDLDGITLNTEGEIIDLILEGGAISVIPKEIAQLTSLEFLDLKRNRLSTLLAEIGQLTSLIELRLSFGFGNLSELPPEIGQLKNLKYLSIAGNELSSLPPEIGQLTNLENLILNENQLTSLPPEIGQLTNLEVLRLDRNQLTELPPEIGLLTKLKMLLLGSNQHTELPPEIGQLTSLTSLSSINGSLTSLPPEIGQLRNLTELQLFNNQLTSLPPEIGFLLNLEKIALTSNNILAIPESIFYLSEFRGLSVFKDSGIPYENTSENDVLISIYAANPRNRLTWGVDNYPGVTFNANGIPKAIIMNNKNLTRIPDNIGELDVLENLTINSNSLTSLPATIGKMNMLAVIAASGNQLTTVPSELGELKNNFALLSVTNNPITGMPQEVCDLQTSNGGILTILTDFGEGCD